MNLKSSQKLKGVTKIIFEPRKTTECLNKATILNKNKVHQLVSMFQNQSFAEEKWQMSVKTAKLCTFDTVTPNDLHKQEYGNNSHSRHQKITKSW